MSEPIGAGTYYIYADDFAFAPVVTRASGTTTVSFGGVTKTINSSSGPQELGKASSGRNTLTITGSGTVNVTWRRGAL